MVTLEEARRTVGDGMTYCPTRGKTRTPLDDGVVTSVNDTYVFVRFTVQGGGVACYPEDLEWLAKGRMSAKQIQDLRDAGR
jgi:hypothetical protein